MKKAIRFTASWCGPCKMFAPMWDRVTSEINDWELEVVDVDANSDIAAKYGIRGIPTVVFEIDGKVVEKKSGVINPSNLKEIFETLSKQPA